LGGVRGVVTLKEVEEEVAGKAYDGRLMRRLLTYMRPYKLGIAASLVFLLINSLLQVAGPLLMKLTIDKYLLPTGKNLHSPLDPISRPIPGPAWRKSRPST
jgi:ABC-type multidrug transport system, ATPase and permease components